MLFQRQACLLGFNARFVGNAVGTIEFRSRRRSNVQLKVSDGVRKPGRRHDVGLRQARLLFTAHEYSMRDVALSSWLQHCDDGTTSVLVDEPPVHTVSTNVYPHPSGAACGVRRAACGVRSSGRARLSTFKYRRRF